MSFDISNILTSETKTGKPLWGLRILGLIMALTGLATIIGLSLSWLGVVGESTLETMSLGLYSSTWSALGVVTGVILIGFGALIASEKHLGYYLLWIGSGTGLIIGILSLLYGLLIWTFSWTVFLSTIINFIVVYYLYMIHKKVNPDACGNQFLRNFCKT